MNISAQTIIEKMEDELLRLSERAEDGHEQGLKEHARVIRAYCDLLIDADSTWNRLAPSRSKPDVSRRQIDQETSIKSEGQEEHKSMTSFKHRRTSHSDLPSTDGNLLEF